MKIGLIGFGKTGKAVASVILQHDRHTLAWVFKESSLLHGRNTAEFLGLESDSDATIFSARSVAIETLLDQHPADVLIDFSSEKSIENYGPHAAERKIIIVSAVSHYGERQQELLKQLAEKTVVFWSPNITLGVNYLLFAAKFLQKIAPWVDIEINEEHFKEKKGVSGTALKIAEELDLEKDEINSVRAGGIVGKHEVIFGFPFQTVRLVHESISREAFGNGVLFAVENLKHKKPGLYHYEDILEPYFSLQ